MTPDEQMAKCRDLDAVDRTGWTAQQRLDHTREVRMREADAMAQCMGMKPMPDWWFENKTGG